MKSPVSANFSKPDYHWLRTRLWTRRIGPWVCALQATAVFSQTEPSIVIQPVSQAVNPFGKVSFMVAAEGSSQLYYQWFRNGTPLPGATGWSLDILPVLPDHRGVLQLTSEGLYSLSVSMRLEQHSVQTRFSTSLISLRLWTPPTWSGGIRDRATGFRARTWFRWETPRQQRGRSRIPIGPR